MIMNNIITSLKESNMKKCVMCQKELSGLQKKYCSRKCKGQDTNNRFQDYKAQKIRGSSRRLKLIEMRGGKCHICGYNKNQSALVFHHLKNNEKRFGIDIRKCSNCTWEKLVEEANKCELLCHNCHNEIHHPDLKMVGSLGLEPRTLRL